MLQNMNLDLKCILNQGKILNEFIKRCGFSNVSICSFFTNKAQQKAKVRAESVVWYRFCQGKWKLQGKRCMV